jgi:hypothetical protein
MALGEKRLCGSIPSYLIGFSRHHTWTPQIIMGSARRHQENMTTKQS